MSASLSACAGRAPTPAPTPGQALPTRLVLALDGVDYRDVMAARERGLFRAFRTPSRLISTFPSISDIAWHDILGVLPPSGYQRVFYSNAYQEVLGTTLDAIRPIEFETRMDMAFETKFHHLGAYLMSNTVARREVDVTVDDFFKFAGRSTVYVYNVGPDALQHTNGNLAGYLAHLDAQMEALRTSYRERTGRELEIVLLSDHGNNHVSGAKFLPIEKALSARGFRIAESLRATTDVAFSVDGVTTGFGVFCYADSVPAVARLLAGMDGVELVSRRVNDSTFAVLEGDDEGRIDFRPGPTGNARADRFRYRPLHGDPLHYASVLAELQAAHAIDADGFADVDAWREHSVTADLPVAVVRIVRGHRTVTLNPSPILVSIRPTHRIGLGLASITDRIFSLGGTHGSLSTASSLGVLMTTFTDTHDDITETVREQLNGFRDLGDVRYRASNGRLTSLALLARDVRGPFAAQVPPSAANDTTLAVEVWLTPDQMARMSDATTVRVDIRPQHADNVLGRVIAERTLPFVAPPSAPAWRASRDGRYYYLPLSALDLPTLARDATYSISVRVADPPDSKGKRTERQVARFTVKTTRNGGLAAW